MKGAQELVQGMEQELPAAFLFLVSSLFEYLLAFFQNLVGQFVPSVMIELFGHNIKFIFVHFFCYFFHQSMTFSTKIFVGFSVSLEIGFNRLSCGIFKDEASDIPELVRKELVCLYLLLIYFAV